MSDQDQTQKPSLMDRLKPHIHTTAIALCTGAIIAIAIKNGSSTSNIIKIELDEPGSICLGASVIKSIKEHGSAMIQLDDETLIDLIDWAHPANDKK